MNEKFMEIPLKHLVGFYEILEMAIFESNLEIVPAYFKEELDKESQEAMNKFVSKLGKDQLPTIEDLLTFNKRVIVRCLEADLKPEEQIHIYLTREDFWSNKVTDDMREKLWSELPQSIRLCHAAGGFFKFLQEKALPRKPVKDEKIIPIAEPPKKMVAIGTQVSKSLRDRMDKDKKKGLF
jgi:hypothetical protein